jgi:hypothetical protein
VSKELRHVEIACTVHSVDNLPTESGEQVYADDVVAEMRDVITAALTVWYQQRGRQLLASPPLVG